MIDALRQILEPAGLSLSAPQYAMLEAYHRLLLEWNKRMDLTNVPAQEMALRHHADSLLPLLQADWFAQGTSLIDVGTGAGFPGLPLAIARPDLQVTLLDALQKRCAFLSAVARELSLSNVRVLHARAEDLARGNERAGFDLAVARAVAPMAVLLEYLLPLVRVDGMALCWKGPSLEEEMAQASHALQVLGGLAGERIALPLPGYAHWVQRIDKRYPTPKQYPRKAGTPAKKPL